MSAAPVWVRIDWKRVSYMRLKRERARGRKRRLGQILGRPGTDAIQELANKFLR
jgi:hypothetical protein